MTFADISIEEVVETPVSTQTILNEIRDMLSRTLDSARTVLASGAVVVSLMSLSLTQDSVITDNMTPAVQVELPPMQVIAHSGISLFMPTDAQRRIEDNMNSLRSLQDGWDGEAALKPSYEALFQANLLTSLLDDKILTCCSLFPSNDSGIFLQGRLPKGRISVYMNGTEMAYVVKGRDGSKLSATVPSTIESVNYLNSGALMYV